MSSHKKIALQVLALLLSQCSVPKKENPLVIEAKQVHNAAVAEAKALEIQLDQLSADSTYLKDSLVSWRIALENWRNNLIEVPGNEEHDQHEHHHHDHENQPLEVTADQMLLIQREMKAQLDSLKSRITKTRNEEHF